MKKFGLFEKKLMVANNAKGKICEECDKKREIKEKIKLRDAKESREFKEELEKFRKLSLEVRTELYSAEYIEALERKEFEIFGELSREQKEKKEFEEFKQLSKKEREELYEDNEREALYQKELGEKQELEQRELEELEAWDKKRRIQDKLNRLRKMKENVEAGIDIANSSRELIPADIRGFVWNRDKGRCLSCGSEENLQFDHIIPVSKGGATTTENLQVLCVDCNLKKSDNI